MKKFFSENSKVITKFIGNQVVMSLLGIMVGLAILAGEGDTKGKMSVLALVGGLFCVFFLCFLHYDNMFFAGEKDGIRARSVGKKPNVFKGLLITLVSYSPTILCAIITIILDLCASDDATGISLFCFYALQGSYLSFYSIINSIGRIGYVLVTLLPTIVFCTLGYALGAIDKPIRQLLGFKIKPPYDGPIEKRRSYKDKGGSDKE